MASFNEESLPGIRQVHSGIKCILRSSVGDGITDTMPCLATRVRLPAGVLHAMQKKKYYGEDLRLHNAATIHI